MKRFSCGDVVPGCTMSFETDSQEALLTQVGHHAHDDHGLVEVTDELIAAVLDATIDA